MTYPLPHSVLDSITKRVKFTSTTSLLFATPPPLPQTANVPLGKLLAGVGVAPGGGVDGEALFPVPDAWLGFPQLSGL